MLPTVCLGYCIFVYVTYCMSRILYNCLMLPTVCLGYCIFVYLLYVQDIVYLSMLPTLCLGYCKIVYVTHCMSRLLYICLNSKYCNDPTKDSGNLHLVKRGEMRRKGRRAWLMGYKKGLGSQREGSLRRRKGGV